MSLVQANTLTPQHIQKIREDFPSIGSLKGTPYTYLDNAATTHKPQSVINAMRDFDALSYATVRRGVYAKSAEATERFEAVRKRVANFIGAKSEKEIVFTTGTTQSINLLAYSFSRAFLSPGDEILISEMEHHANIVPWQVVAAERGLVLKVIPVNDEGELELEEYGRLLSKKTKLLAITHISNALGTVNPIKAMIEEAHLVGAKVLVDGAQSVAHMKIDVRDLDCDFYAFSAHKMYGPNAVGVLYGKYDLLEAMPPYMCGGEMVREVGLHTTSYALPPTRFEPGTPAITQIIGFGYALEYLEGIGFEKLTAYESQLFVRLEQALSRLPGLRVIGTAKQKAGLISFHLDYAHPHDVVTILDQYGVAARGGHHCAQPIMKRFGLPATTRVSLALYNTVEEFDTLLEALEEVRKTFL